MKIGACSAWLRCTRLRRNTSCSLTKLACPDAAYHDFGPIYCSSSSVRNEFEYLEANITRAYFKYYTFHLTEKEPGPRILYHVAKLTMLNKQFLADPPRKLANYLSHMVWIKE